MRRIQFDSVLQACDVVQLPGLVVEEITRAGPSRQQERKWGLLRTGSRSGARYCNVALYAPAWDMPGSAEAPSRGPPTRSHLPSSAVLGQWDRTGLGQLCNEKFDLGFFHSCFICPTLAPSPTAGSLLFLQEGSSLPCCQLEL